MKIELSMNVGHTTDELLYMACKKAGYTTTRYKIIRQSIDARHNNVKLNYIIDLDPEENSGGRELVTGSVQLSQRPVIVGMGPAGLFAAYYLALYGYNPLVLERGSDIDNRKAKTETFWSKGILDTESNAQFGEGGAGAFSDGKLTTRINDVRCDEVLDLFVKCGAPEEILYKSKPHIGTDKLVDVVKNLRNMIISMGGQVEFDVKVKGITVKNGSVSSLLTGSGNIPCDTAVFAIGHSARDTYKALYDAGVSFTPKPFAIGLRIEHKQTFIDNARYGRFAGNPSLGAADYQLAARAGDRGCFSFCMCPGGVVVASASEYGETVTNGMSYFARDLENANSALLVGVSTNDFGTGVFDGVEFQKHYEQKAFREAGGHAAPVQLLGDFLKGIASTRIGSVKPSFTNGYKLTSLTHCLPSFVTDTIAVSMKEFDRKIKNFSQNDAILTGVETRSSAPVTMVRGRDFQSVSVASLYPCGEGAGYAGGIVSAAVDGIKVAEEIIKRYVPF